MNTPGDTDEGRPRPSVWPVYLAAATIAVVLPAFLPPPRGPAEMFTVLGGAFFLLPCAIGVLIALGLVLLQPWAWWCAVGWTIAILFTPGMAMAIHGFFFHWGAGSGVGSLIVEKMTWLALFGAPITLIMWPLATCRQLFFPPKPESEE